MIGSPSDPGLLSRLGPPLIVGVVAVLGTAVATAVDPGGTRLSICPLLALAGVACPLCGGLRAVHALTQGDVPAALSFNALLVVTLPLLVLGWAAWVRRAASRPGPVAPTWVVWAGLGVAVGFGVLRNLPPLVPWLTPWLAG